jgi:all-trans-retinol dehydrogenase (NAD+)
VTDPDTVYATAKQVKETLGAPTILINNAGILAPHTILATPDPYLRKLFDVNVLANWYTTKAFLPAMIAANKGHIVTVASMASFIGVAGLADYCASKAAVLSFHEALDQELKHHYEAAGVLTTSVHPGWIRTPLLKEVEGELKAGGAEMIEPEDVAEAVVNRIVGCSGGQVFLPGSGAMGSGMRGWPNWVQERVRDGASRALLGSATVKAG